MKVDLKNATIKIKDGTTPVPNELEIKIGEGNLTFVERVEREYSRDKGLLDTVRNGDQQPVDVNLEFVWEWLKADTGEPPTPIDALKRRGTAAAWLSSSSDSCEPYCVDIEIYIDADCDDGTRPEVILLPDFRYEELNYDLSAGQVAVTGKCNVTDATVTRVDAIS